MPARDAAGNISGCFPGFCLGGDLTGNVDAGRSLKSRIDRYNGYGRVGFEFTPGSEVYATFNYGRVKTQNQPVNGQNRPGLTIQCSNPFLPGSIATACANAGITSFRFGTSNASLGNTQVHTDREQVRAVIGAKGSAEVGGTEWTYDTYYEHGVNKTRIDVDNILLSNRFNAAIDAVLDNGVIVCRSAVARANGCVPLNIFGDKASEAARNYIMPEAGPYQRTRQTQDVASINFSGSPVELWAGPLSVAFGGEWRREHYRVTADPYGAGFANTPAGGDYPADPLLIQGGNNWYAGNYKNGNGTYTVKEAYLEVDVPILNSDSTGKLNINAAGRVTDYSTSGTVWAWKVGGTWDLPVDGLRVRSVMSRDVRAPNLSELFAAPVTTTLPNFFDPFTNSNVLAIQNTIGNTALTPEFARNNTAGIALANPSWLPGLNLSFDWYQIKIKDVISSLGANDIVQLCFQKVLNSTCSAFNLSNTNGPNFINVQAFNLASINTSGCDIEASYRWQQPLGLPGSFTFRGLATHVIKFITDTGLPGTLPVDTAGNNNGATPDWKFLLIQSYENDKFSLLVQERWFSDGVIGNQYVVCSAGTCPASTSQRPTIDQNFLPGAFYLDIGGSVNITEEIVAYAKVDNVFDNAPARTNIFSNPALYDGLGRIYRAGVRFRF